MEEITELVVMVAGIWCNLRMTDQEPPPSPEPQGTRGPRLRFQRPSSGSVEALRQLGLRVQEHMKAEGREPVDKDEEDVHNQPTRNVADEAASDQVRSTVNQQPTRIVEVQPRRDRPRRREGPRRRSTGTDVLPVPERSAEPKLQRREAQRRPSPNASQEESFSPMIALPLDRAAGRVGAVLGVAAIPGVLETRPDEFAQASFLGKALYTAGASSELAALHATLSGIGNEFTPLIGAAGVAAKFVGRMDMALHQGNPTENPFKSLREEHGGIQFFEKASEAAVRVFGLTMFSKPEMSSRVAAIRRDIRGVAEVAVPVVTYALTKDFGTALDMAIILKGCNLVLDEQDALKPFVNKVVDKISKGAEVVSQKWDQLRGESRTGTPDEIAAIRQHNLRMKNEFTEHGTFHHSELEQLDQNEATNVQRQQEIDRDREIQAQIHSADREDRMDAYMGATETGQQRLAEAIRQGGPTVRLDQDTLLREAQQRQANEQVRNLRRQEPYRKALANATETDRRFVVRGFEGLPQKPSLSQEELDEQKRQRLEKREANLESRRTWWRENVVDRAKNFWRRVTLGEDQAQLRNSLDQFQRIEPPENAAQDNEQIVQHLRPAHEEEFRRGTTETNDEAGNLLVSQRVGAEVNLSTSNAPLPGAQMTELPQEVTYGSHLDERSMRDRQALTAADRQAAISGNLDNQGSGGGQ